MSGLFENEFSKNSENLMEKFNRLFLTSLMFATQGEYGGCGILI